MSLINITINHPDKRYSVSLKKQFEKVLPNHNIELWNENSDSEYLITWKTVQKEIAFNMPKLKVIFALAAGIDAFISKDIEIRKDIKIVRLEEAGMGNQMLEFALYGILYHARDMALLTHAQKQKKWLGISTPKRLPFSTKIGVMGLGKIGGFVAQKLSNLGYPVSGYSYSKKNLEGVCSYDLTELDSFLANSEILINLLPLTSKTKDILNISLFSKMPKSSFLINIARGGHLKEEDLIEALNLGYLQGALLDVFKTEPLPQNHPFYNDNRIIITPHLAAITLQEHAISQISKNIIAYEKGEKLTGLIDKNRGY